MVVVMPRYGGDHKAAAKKMDKIRAKRAGSLGKLGRSIASFFDKKKAKKADSVKLNKKKVSDFHEGFNK